MNIGQWGVDQDQNHPPRTCRPKHVSDTRVLDSSSRINTPPAYIRHIKKERAAATEPKGCVSTRAASTLYFTRFCIERSSSGGAKQGRGALERKMCQTRPSPVGEAMGSLVSLVSDFFSVELFLTNS